MTAKDVDAPARRSVDRASESRFVRSGDEPLIAYLHLRRDAGAHTRAVLEGHVESFARREGFTLVRILIGVETDRQSEALGVQALVAEVEATGAKKVLVVGPARQALVALHRMTGVCVVTLAQVRPAGQLPVKRRARARSSPAP